MAVKKGFILSRSEKAAKRRLDIVEAAAACFIAKGFHQSSMRDIASVAGVSLGNLYNHFENKAELIKGLAALEAEENEHLLALLTNKGNVTDILHDFTKLYFASTREPNNAALAAEIFAEAQRNEEILEIFDVNRQRVISVLAALLSRGQEDGQIDRQLAPSIIAVLILDLVEGAALRAALSSHDPSQDDLPTLHRMIEKAVQA
ncbi:MAG: TetR/AcrR family transcriptional regulator [Sneathiella sp.]